MYNLEFTEEELSIVLQALSYYQYNGQYVTQEQFDIVQKILDKIDERI